MTVRELIVELLNYEMDDDVEICCYPSVGDENHMVIYDNIYDKHGNNPCQVNMEICLVNKGKGKVYIG